MPNPNQQTLDGEPISPIPPFGAPVVVYKQDAGQHYILDISEQ